MKSVNEMFIGLGLAVFFSLVAMSAYGDTVINYDDGSTYTLKNNEVIYVAPTQRKHYTIQTYNQGDVFFRQQAPWANRDYVPEPTDNASVGSHQWCKAYVPWSEGLTFDMIAWQRSCDTNNDGKYGCGDTQFDESSEGGVCAA